jgi:hypothetical protein
MTSHYEALGAFVILLIAIQGCSVAALSPEGPSQPSSEVSSQTPPRPRAAPSKQSGVSGVWEGTSTVTCEALITLPGRCGAVENITFTMLQRDSDVTGFYKCATGNMVCLNVNETGVIRGGTVSGGGRLSFRVMLPDGSSCFFTAMSSPEEMAGGYSCYQGGGLLEQGRWHVQRSY